MLFIFDHEPIEYDEVDFAKWLTDDGEEVLIEEMSDEVVLNTYHTLKRRIKMQPEHINVEIWESYQDCFAKECKERKIGKL